MTERDANAGYNEFVGTNTYTSNDEPEDNNSREVLLAAAAKLIQQIQAPEPMPQGLVLSEETESQPDLYSLFEALTALRQETSLQGRNVHQFTQTLEQLLARMREEHSGGETLQAIQDDLRCLRESIDIFSADQREAGQEEGFDEAFDYLVEPLLDTHDQFRRLDEQYQRRSTRSGWLRFLQTNDDADGFRQTVHLTLKKLNQRLDAVRIVPTARAGMEFDPLTMKAVELEESGAVAPNRVLDVFKQGYLHEERVLRYAEVKVSVAEPDHK